MRFSNEAAANVLECRHDRSRTSCLLVLQAGTTDDLRAALPALRALRRTFPGHHVVLAGPVAHAPIARAEGGVDAVIESTLDEPLHSGLRRADVAVNLHDGRADTVELLIETHPTRLISYGVDGAPAWDDAEADDVRWTRLLAAFDVAVDQPSSDDDRSGCVQLRARRTQSASV